VSDVARPALISGDQYEHAIAFKDVSEALQGAILNDEWLPYMNLGVSDIYANQSKGPSAYHDPSRATEEEESTKD